MCTTWNVHYLDSWIVHYLDCAHELFPGERSKHAGSIHFTSAFEARAQCTCTEQYLVALRIRGRTANPIQLFCFAAHCLLAPTPCLAICACAAVLHVMRSSRHGPQVWVASSALRFKGMQHAQAGSGFNCVLVAEEARRFGQGCIELPGALKSVLVMSRRCPGLPICTLLDEAQIRLLQR